jgi:tight adherence protein C
LWSFHSHLRSFAFICGFVLWTTMLTAILFGIAAFATVACLLGAGLALLDSREGPLAERLEELRLNAMAGGARAERRRSTGGLLGGLGFLISRLPGGEDWLSEAERDLGAAGVRRKDAAVLYVILSIASIAGSLSAVLYFSRQLDLASILSFSVGSLMVGYYLPKRILKGMVARYRQKLTEALPDMVDLLGIVLGTGLSLDQAFIRVSQEMQHIYPQLAEELYLLTVQMQAGQERSAAFRQLVKRTGVEDVKSLAAMIVQSERFGTSLSQALKVYSESLRTRRRLRAEASIGRAGIKMLFATVLLIFPVFFVITLVPSILAAIQTFTTIRR